MVSEENECLLVEEQPMQPNVSMAEPTTQNKTVILKKKPKAALPADQRFDVGHIVQTLTQLAKEEVLQALDMSEEDTEYTLFVRGGVLSVIRKNKYYDPWPSFDKYIEASTTMSRSTAHALAQTYEAIVDAGLTGEQVKTIGWTKLRAIASKLPEDADHWLKLAEQSTKAELIELVRGQSPDMKSATKVGADAGKTFKLNKAQTGIVEKAIGVVKEKTGVKHDADALERICADFVSGDGIESKLMELGSEELVQTITHVLDNLDKKVVQQVVEKVFSAVKHKIEVES